MNHRVTYKYVPFCARCRAIAHIERNVATEPRDWIDIALRPETASDSCETALWLDTLLRRIHREVH